MTSPRQTLTIQCGSFSNFIGTHFWNQQQEQCNVDVQRQDGTSFKLPKVCSSSLFSEHADKCYRTIRYIPRLVVADVPGALGGNVENADALQCNGSSTTAGGDGLVSSVHCPHTQKIQSFIPTDNCSEVKKAIEPHQISSYHAVPRQRVPVHPYIQYLNNPMETALPHDLPNFQFESSVRYFTDFFIPEWDSAKQAELVPGLMGSEQPTFNSFVLGEMLARTTDPDKFWDSFTNKIRLQLEDIDCLGMIHLSVDWLTGFGGIGAECLRWLREQAPKASVLVSGWQHSESGTSASPEWMDRRVGGGLFLQACLDELSHNTGNGLLLSDFHGTAPPAHYSESLYLASALPALALDTATVFSRLQGAPSPLAADIFQGISSVTTQPLLTLLFTTIDNLVSASKHKTPATGATGCDPLLDLAGHLWDIRGVPTGGTRLQSSIISSKTKESSSVADICKGLSFLVSRGLPREETDWWSASIKDRYLSLDQSVSLAVPFPQQVLGPEPFSTYPSISTLACWAPDATPWKTRAVLNVSNAVARALRFNRAGGSESEIERERLLDLSNCIHNMLDNDDISEE